MVTRGRLTDNICCWVQIVVVVPLVLSKVSCVQCKRVVNLAVQGSSLHFVGPFVEALSAARLQLRLTIILVVFR